MSRIFWIVVIVCAVVFAAVWYANRSRTRAVNSGDVYVRGQAGDKKLEAPETVAPATAPATEGEQQSAGAPEQSAAEDAAVSPPAADSIRRDPPNGMIFAGSGKYQLYRQGDITWRLDTDTGRACILFATDAEWRKARVYQQGCGAS